MWFTRMATSLEVVARRLWSNTRAHFRIYLNPHVPSSAQREVVSYTTTGRAGGGVRRSELSRGGGDVIRSPEVLVSTLFMDVTKYASCYYTFVSSPIIGVDLAGEDDEHLSAYQTTCMRPVSELHPMAMGKYWSNRQRVDV